MISKLCSKVKRGLLANRYVDDFLLSRDASMRFEAVEKYFKSGSKGAELGVFKGHFSKLILERTDVSHFWIVDPWYLNGDWGWAGGDRCSLNGFRSAVGKLRLGLKAKRVSIHIGNDLDFLKDCPDQCFDWVYVDSSHQFDHTIAELDLLLVKVKTQGYIIGDDWVTNPNHKDYGVAKAILKTLAEKASNIRLIYSNEFNRQWVIQVL